MFCCFPCQCIKKVVKFSFTKQKIFWVLVFSFMYLVSEDPIDRSKITKSLQNWWIQKSWSPLKKNYGWLLFRMIEKYVIKFWKAIRYQIYWSAYKKKVWISKIFNSGLLLIREECRLMTEDCHAIESGRGKAISEAKVHSIYIRTASF